jgi:hypothetical protein
MPKKSLLVSFKFQLSLMTFTKGWKKYLNLTVDFDFVASVVIAVSPQKMMAVLCVCFVLTYNDDQK